MFRVLRISSPLDRSALATLVAFCTSVACLASTALLISPSPALAQGEGEADSMFRFLDANRDGRLTLDEGDGNARRMLQQIFQMAGKPQNGTVSRDEFQRVFDQHRAANGRRAQSNAGQNSGPENRPNSGQNSGPNNVPPMPRGAERSPDRSAADRNVPDRNAARTPARRDPSARTPLEGVWRGWVVEGRGERPNDGQMELELTVQGNTITGRELGTRRAPGGVGSGTFIMTATNGTSGQLDADGAEGPTQGRFYAGIYELQGDTLRWCVSNRARQRPEQMATDRGNYLMVLQRVR